MNKLCQINRWPPGLFFGNRTLVSYLCLWHACVLPASISSELCSVPHQSFWQWQSPNLISRSHHFPSLGALKQSAFTLFSTDLYSLGVEGVPLIGGISKFHQLLKLVCQTMTFFPPLLLIITFEEMTIKHLMYMKKSTLSYTERACVVFSSFEICPGRFVMSNEV